MPERSTLTERVQLGMESTIGTPVAATRALTAMSIAIDPEVEFDEFRPSGNKFTTLVSPTQDAVSGDVEGRATYNEIVYPLSMCIGTGTNVVQGSARKWTFKPNSTSPDTPLSATVEVGSSVRAGRAAGVVLTDFELEFSRDDGVTVGGSVLGRRYEDGITLSAGATELTPLPVLIAECSAYLDSTFGGLGTTKLTRLRSAKVSIGSRFSPVWVVDAAQVSWVAIVESEPSVEVELTLEADAQGEALLAAMRAGASRYLRLEAIGPVAGAGPDTHLLRVDVAAKVSGVDGIDDDDGLAVRGWTLTGVHDAGLGSALQFVVQNTLTTL